MKGQPQSLPVEYGKPGYQGRKAQRADKRQTEKWLSKLATRKDRKMLRSARVAEHWTRQQLGGHL